MLALADPGLGSPPQLEATMTDKKMSAVKGLANFGGLRTCLAGGGRKVMIRPSPAASGLPEAVVILQTSFRQEML